MICIGASVPTTRIPHHQLTQDRKQIFGGTSANLRSSAATVRRSTIQMESTSKALITSQPLILTSGASGRVTALFSLRALRSLLILFNSFLLLLLLPFRRRTIVVSEKLDGEREKSTPAAGTSTGVVVRVPSAMVVRRAKESEAAARRAMAIRRLRQIEEEEKEKKTSSREFSLFSTTRGDTLFTRSWTPTAVQTK